jgi:hypothetical protein
LKRGAGWQATGLAAGTILFLAYLSAPLFHSNFGEVQVRPLSLLQPIYDVFPFSLWREIVMTYQPRRFEVAIEPTDLTCEMMGGASVSIVGEGDCRIEATQSRPAFGPYFGLRSGRYILDFDLGVSPACRGGSGAVDVVANAATFTIQRQVVDVSGPVRVTFPIEIPRWLMLSADIETRLIVSDGCIGLENVSVRPVAPQ